MGDSSTALDLIDGTSEHVAFFDGLFGVTHVPKGEVRSSLVVCSPIFSEFLKNNRREVMLGRRLAAEGIAVQRFHYRGTGNSDGDPNALTLDTMSADAASAAEHLRDVTGGEGAATLGTLLGAFPAVAIADSDTPIALWDPVLDGGRYFKDLVRTLVIVGMSHGVEVSSEELEIEFQRSGRLDIAGFSVPRSLHDSARAQKLEAPAGTAPALVVQLGRKAEISSATARLVQKLEDRGRTVSVEPVPAREAWWFHQDIDRLRPEEGAILDSAMIEPTVRWLTEAAAR